MQGKKLTIHRKLKNNEEYQDDTGLLSTIPEKRYFTISEAAFLCGVKPHVLRYWEQEFHQLKPAKRRGNRRYYQHKDVLMVRQIRALLYEQGFTIEGARAQLLNTPQVVSPIVQTDSVVKELIADLEAVLKDLKTTLLFEEIH